MSESVTIGDQSFIKDPTKGWIDKKTKQPADKGLLRLLDSLNLQPVERQLKVDIDNSIEPITLSATEKYVFDRNSGWIDAKTKKPAAPDMLKLLNSLKSKIDVAEDTSTPKPTPKVKSKPKKPAKVEETTEAAPEPEEQVKGSKFKSLAKGFAGGFLGSYGIDLQKILDEKKEKKEAEAERLQEIKDTYYTVEESDAGVKKYRDAKTGRFISPKTAADYDILAQEEFKKEKRKKLIKDTGKGFAGGFLGSYGIDLQKIIDEKKEKKEAAAAKANGEEESAVDKTKKGPAEKGPKALDKPSISALSNSFTNLITAFNGMDTYSKNTNAIFKAQQDAKTDVAKENVLENDITPAPVASGGGDSSSEYLASALPGVTEQLGTLTDLISSGALQGSGSSPLDLIDGRRGGRMSFGKKAAIVGGIAAAGAIGYAATRSSSSPSGEGAAVKQQTAKATTQAAGVKEQADKAEKQRENILSGKSSMLGSFGSTMASWLGSTFNTVNDYVTNIGSNIMGAVNSGFGAIEQGLAQLTGSTGSTAAEFIANFEGFMPRAKWDHTYYALGYGHQIQNDDLRSGQLGKTGVPVIGPQGMHTVINRAQATALLQEDLPKYEAPVRRILGPSYSKLSEAQKAAFISYSYNAGGGNANRGTGLAGFVARNNIVQLIEQNNMPGVAQAFRDRGVRTASGRVVSGLVKRRAAEADLISRGFTGGIAQTVAGNVGSAAGQVVETAAGAAGSFVDQITAIPGNLMSFIRLNSSNINLNGLVPGMTRRFTAMAAEFNQRTGRKIGVNSAYRSPQEQAALFRRYGSPRAARPGRSRHEVGMAIDINSVDGNALAQLGLLNKYGFIRPVRGEAWHIEPVESRNGQPLPDNPYTPGRPIAAAAGRGTPVNPGTGRPTPRPVPARPSAVVADSAHAAIDKVARATDRAYAAGNRAYNAAASSARSAFNYLTGAPSRAVAPSTARRMNKEYQRALGHQ